MLLITGATGYLGSALVDLAVRDGYDVRVLVRDPRKAEALLPAGVDVAVGDLTDAASLERAACGCRSVLHVAATAGSSPAETRRANVDGTAAVLAAATAAGVSRFVHTSSGAAIIDADGLVAEQPSGPPALTDAYSLSKAAAGIVARRGRRSEVYGRFPPVRVDDAGARALGFTPSGVDDGLARTAAWLSAN